MAGGRLTLVTSVTSAVRGVIMHMTVLRVAVEVDVEVEAAMEAAADADQGTSRKIYKILVLSTS